jgi:thiol-disulfide isomerase/thioredoxin
MLIEFYGEECPHCIEMKPLIERLEKEAGVEVKKYEVWHDSKNAKLMDKYAKDRCEGVPFFFNTITEDSICGAVGYKDVKKWAGVSDKK